MKNETLALIAGAVLFLLTRKGGFVNPGLAPNNPRSQESINTRWTTTWMNTKTPASPTPMITLPAEVLIGQAVPLPRDTKIFPATPGTYSINQGTYIEYYQVV